jgi:photosystem II stability/assembly factor-like uncharacterized protein
MARSLVVLLGCLVAALLVVARPGVPSGEPVPREGPENGDDWFALQRAYPTGRRPPADALDRAMASRREAPGRRPALALTSSQWVSIGPSPIFVNNTQPYAGRVTAVATHPTLPGTIYIGADAGGIWRTTDGGVRWVSLTDNIPVPAIQSIAIDPVNPQFLYASTIQRTYGIRWLSSTDAGATWSVSSIRLADGRALSPALCSVNVYKACIPPSSGRIFIDPLRAGSAQTSTIYYVGASTLLRSDDSGRTFRPVLALPVDLDFAGAAAPAQNPEAAYLRDAALDPTRPDRLLAVVVQPKCLNSECTLVESAVAAYRSFDAGAHWTAQTLATLRDYDLTDELAVRYSDPGPVYVPRARVAIAPSSPDTMAVAVRDLFLERPRVFRSINAGDSWSETAGPPTSLTWPLALAFSPTDANTMYVGSGGVGRTTNGGQSWAALTPTHADNIAVTFTADRSPLIVSDGGIYKGTATSNTLTVLHHALPITEFYSVSAHPSNPLLLAGGTQDNGTLVYQGNMGWSLMTGGDGGDTVWDPDPQTITVYAEIEWIKIGNSNVFNFLRCQVGQCLTRRTGIDLSLDGPFAPRMAMDPSNSSTIWLTAERLFRTDSRGDSWVAASPSVGNDLRCWNDPGGVQACARSRYFTAAAVAPTASQTVYGGTLNGDVRVTNDRGLTWRSIAGAQAGPLPVRAINEVIVDPLNALSVYVSYSGFNSGGSGNGHVFHSPDGGQTWNDISGNLPDVPVNTLMIDPDSVGSGTPRVMYAGTDIGVFRATLTGAAPQWEVFGTGLPPVVVTRLTYNRTTRQLLAATYGRGIWAISSRFSK